MSLVQLQDIGRCSRPLSALIALLVRHAASLVDCRVAVHIHQEPSITMPIKLFIKSRACWLTRTFPCRAATIARPDGESSIQ